MFLTILEISDSNMNSIISLKKTGFEVGYSDHAIGIENCLVAASLGARVIEKHFTISNNFNTVEITYILLILNN